MTDERQILRLVGRLNEIRDELIEEIRQLPHRLTDDAIRSMDALALAKGMTSEQRAVYLQSVPLVELCAERTRRWREAGHHDEGTGAHKTPSGRWHVWVDPETARSLRWFALRVTPWIATAALGLWHLLEQAKVIPPHGQ